MNSKSLYCVFSVLIVFALADSAGSQEAATHQHADTNQEQKFNNALTKETSPYLLMHAHNPVNWYGWGEEALSLAKKSNKPIFLSIGYSSCHWCHVMERESFLDEEIATFLNENFVCIKVDREERPDVDAIYMESLMVVNRGRGGGWPLSMFLTPEAKPFFGGTYFPARDGDRGARFGFLTIVKRVHDAWNNTQDKVLQDANVVTRVVKSRLAGQNVAADAQLNKSWARRCASQLGRSFDAEFGGFRYSPQDPQIPKFPQPSNLEFLIDQIRRRPNETSVKQQLLKTCERMMMGGILDHVGGGFHRYSVDRYWKIPHFEKMLYDNGQLATVYSEAFAVTKRIEFQWVVDDLLEFVMRELKDKEGAFYSSLDAESEGEEGKFYRWTLEELKSSLSHEEFQLAAEVYGFNRNPNFEQQYFVPQLRTNVAQTAKRVGMSGEALRQKLKPIRLKLFEIRARRVRPLTDTKILASWNGMMIRGFADAGRIFENERYLQAARDAAEFVLNKMTREDGRLVRTFTDGQAKLNAYAPDYACMIDGLLALHRATDESKWLEAADKLQGRQDELFWDETNGGYFYTSSDHESLLARAKKSNDGAVPSGNSVATANLLYLAEELDRPKYREQARRTALAAAPLLEQAPVSAPRLLVSVEKLLEDQ